MERKFSVIIPTMLKCPDIFKTLLDTLEKEEPVKEIIIIDNSGNHADGCLIEDLCYKYNKTRIYFVAENIYVNPAWNYGVSLAKYDYIALLNDDIIIPENTFTILAQAPWEQIGITGAYQGSIKPIDNLDKFYIDKINFFPIDTRWNCFGVFMVMHRDRYVTIPEELKIWCGDDFLFHINRVRGKHNYMMNFPLKTDTSATPVKEKTSVTSDLPEFDVIKQKDLKQYELIKQQYDF